MKKKIAIAVLVVICCINSVYAVTTERIGIFHRFVWVENLTIPPNQIISLEPIDTSKYTAMIVQVTEKSGQSFYLTVCVESRIFSDENFRVTGLMGGQKTTFVLSNTSIEQPAKLTCGVYGTETKLDIVNTGSETVTVKVSGALLKGSSTLTKKEGK